MARAMKSSGIEWIGEIPQDWLRCKIKNVCMTIGSGTTPSSHISEYYDGGTINWIQSGDIYGKSVVSDVATQVTFTALRSIGSLRIYTAPFIVIAMYGGSVGNIAISLIDACTNQACCCLMPSSDVDLKYLYYWLSTCKADFLVKAEGGGQPNISQEKIKNQWMYKPPYRTQCCISTYLDTKCTEIDALTTDIQAQIETLEQYKRSVITEAVTKGLNMNVPMKDSDAEWIGSIPTTWSMQRGKYVFQQKNDHGNVFSLVLLSPTQSYGVIPQEMYEQLSGFSAVKLNENTDLDLLKTVHKGAFVISLRSFQGGFEYSRYEGVVSPAYQVFYPVMPIVDGYYRHLFKTQVFIDKMNSYTMSLRDGKNIAFADFGRTYIPVPPIEEQQAIASYLDAKCAEIDAIIDGKRQQLAVLEEYKKSVIFEYLTGKKEVPVA